MPSFTDILARSFTLIAARFIPLIIGYLVIILLSSFALRFVPNSIINSIPNDPFQKPRETALMSDIVIETAKMFGNIPKTDSELKEENNDTSENNEDPVKPIGFILISRFFILFLLISYTLISLSTYTINPLFCFLKSAYYLPHIFALFLLLSFNTIAAILLYFFLGDVLSPSVIGILRFTLFVLYSFILPRFVLVPLFLFREEKGLFSSIYASFVETSGEWFRIVLDYYIFFVILRPVGILLLIGAYAYLVKSANLNSIISLFDSTANTILFESFIFIPLILLICSYTINLAEAVLYGE